MSRESNYAASRENRTIRQFLYRFRNCQSDPNFARLLRGRELRNDWRREQSRVRWNRRHPELQIAPPYRPPATEQEEQEETLALFLLAEQHDMGPQLSALCERMRKLGRDELSYQCQQDSRKT